MANKSNEAKERALVRAREWKARNRERCRELRRRYRLANKERENANNKRWLAEHPEQARELSRRHLPYIRDWQAVRKAERTGLAAMFRPKDVRATYAGRCWACGATERTGMDHITPLTRGGVNYAHNVRLLCGSCNARKQRRLDHEVADHELRARLLLGHEAFNACFGREAS